MSAITQLRALLAKGVDLETAMAMAEAFETSAQAEHDKLVANLLDRLSVDAKAEARRAKDRDRKAAKKRGIPRNSAESAEQEKSPTPPKEKLPIPPLKGGTSQSSAPPEKPKTKALSVWASEIWELTSHRGRQRSSKREVENALRAAVRRGADPAAVKAGVGGYYASPDATKNAGEFAKGCHRVIQSDLWQAFEPLPDPPSPEDEDPWSRRMLGWRTNGYWNSEWGPKPGKPGYLGPSLEDLAA